MAIERTVVIVGSGGVGKSPLDELFKDTVGRIDPYRLRPNGPRNSGDKLYAPPKLHDDLNGLLKKLGDQEQLIPNEEETIEWHPRGKVLLFTVRRVWQSLSLSSRGFMSAQLAKAEIYAPVLEVLLERCDDFKAVLGKIEIVILNPAKKSLTKMANWDELKTVTRHNCEKRGDLVDSIEKRVKFMDVETPVWRRFIEKGATECAGWEFEEYRYPKEEKYNAARAVLLLQVRKHLAQANPSLAEFLKSDAEL